MFTHLRWLFTIGFCAAVGFSALVPGADGAGARTSQPVTRLWYRVGAEITLKRAGDFGLTGAKQHHETTVSLRLRSRTAFVLFRQCTALGVPDGDPKRLARLTTLTRTTATCAEVRRYLRQTGESASWIRSLQLVDDVRFTVAGEGSVEQFERTVAVPAHTTTTPAGSIVDCPDQIVDIVRTTGPEKVGGALFTASAARDGVAAAIAFPSRLDYDVEVGSEGRPCLIRATGQTFTQPRLARGFSAGSAVFGDVPQYGPVPAPAGARFRIGTRFERPFTVRAPLHQKEPMADGTWETTGTTVLTFTPCPRGGRNVARC